MAITIPGNEVPMALSAPEDFTTRGKEARTARLGAVANTTRGRWTQMATRSAAAFIKCSIQQAVVFQMGMLSELIQYFSYYKNYILCEPSESLLPEAKK